MSDSLEALKEAYKHAALPALNRALANVKVQGLTSQKIFILRNHTLDNLTSFLKAQGLLDGIDAQVQIGDYDVILPYVMNSASPLHTQSPHIILLSWVVEGLTRGKMHDEELLSQIPKRCQQEIEAILEHAKGTLLVHTLSLPAMPGEGLLTFKQNKGLYYWVTQTNELLKEMAQKYPRVFIIDIQAIEKRLGRAQCFDWRLWLMAKSLFTPILLREIAIEIGALMRALSGKTKKCLVLDCDQTLWGGIVGEDGLEGIALSPDEYPGNMYYQFQSQILSLQQKGVILALCSKNNPEDVWQVLEQHPHCLIKKEHIVAFRINWEDKASNLQALAQELNLGLDSFVLVDDNPMECAWVKQALPEVEVLQLPDPLWAQVDFLLGRRLFETMSVTQEDLERTRMYQKQADRRSVESSFVNMDDFLRSLELKVILAKAQNSDIPRISQLTQKTNQFNLTTRRYSEKDIEQILSQGDDVLTLKVSDRFGDFGLVGVVIVKYNLAEASIDTFLLSCRVLGRKVEEVALDQALKQAKSRGAKTVLGEFIPTAKNHQTEDFYKHAGFQLVEQQPNGSKDFVLPLDSWQAKSWDYMQVALSK